MENQEQQTRIDELSNGIVDLCESFNDLPPYEIGVRLIVQATTKMLFCAPNQLIAMKIIMAAIEMGISEFQELNK